MFKPKCELDTVEQNEKFIASPRFVDLNRQAVHDAFLSQTLDGQNKKVPHYVLDHVHDRLQAFFGATAINDEQFNAEKEIIDNLYWPQIRERLLTNPGMVQFFLEYGVYSRYALTFLYDAWNGDLALSVLPAHFVARSVLGKLETIPTNDGCYVFCATDASFQFIRYRAVQMQESLANAKNVLMLGGGLDPVLWTHGYDHTAHDQKIVIYDTRDYSARLDTLLDDNHRDLHIKYRVQPMQSAFADSAQYGQYDLILLSGVASYYPTKLPDILRGCFALLQSGGKLVLDFQVMHSVYKFDIATLGWPATMHPEQNIPAACSHMQDTSAAAGFKVVRNSYPNDSAKPEQAPAGIVFWLEKP